jgi:hypothetical protein
VATRRPAIVLAALAVAALAFAGCASACCGVSRTVGSTPTIAAERAWQQAVFAESWPSPNPSDKASRVSISSNSPTQSASRGGCGVPNVVAFLLVSNCALFAQLIC